MDQNVKEITIDAQTSQLTFILGSIMSGQKNKTYDLREVKTELTASTTWTKILFSPLTLKIFLPTKESFSISGRYGFLPDTLTAIDNVFCHSSDLVLA